MTVGSRFFACVFLLAVVQFKYVLVFGDCWYDNKKHEENVEVPTGEPCLNCTCSRSVLLCYLRVCPKLPNPPPPGCILLHRHRTCCPELICSDFYDGGNSLEARADPEGGLDILSDDQSAYENACISNGSIYGPGSAMHTSSLCEYCYCLAGKQVCVKPKCLLPIEGCSPVFEETSCCPVRYNCTRDLLPAITTEEATTIISTTKTEFHKKDGCLVEGIHYNEGSKVIGIGHSVCDNCYCLRGLLRCEPFSCAPPLLGCTPVIKPGECCAASYNCNGTLEIEPEPNYGLFPIISKEYSKLRKEVHRKPSPSVKKDGVVTVAPFYVLAETLQEPTTKLLYQRSPDTYGTTRQFSGTNWKPSTQKPSTSDNFFLISSSKQRSSTEKSLGYKLNYEFQNNNNYKRVFSTTLRSNIRAASIGRVHTSTASPPKAKEEENDDYLGLGNLNILSIVDSLLDGKMNRRADEAAQHFNFTAKNNKTNLEYSIEDFKEEPITISSTLESTVGTTDITEFTTTTVESSTVTDKEDVEETTLKNEDNEFVTVTTVLKSTDCINNVMEKGAYDTEITTILPVNPEEINKLAESRTDFITTTDIDTEEPSSENSFTKEIVLPDVESRKKLKINGSKLPPDIEAILNISKYKNGEDFDYDYNEPTLPPSLPNLKIIPFVAADALDTKKGSFKDPTPVYIEKKKDVLPLVYSSNMFKPPAETEGGFVPKEPSIIDSFYDNVLSVTSESSNQHNAINCLSEGQEIHHGTSVASKSPCITCTCFYGNIVCQKSNCPPPKAGCKVVLEQGANLCCPNYVCDEPLGSSLEIASVPQEVVTVAEGIVPADPFKDVIRTEPAPNLQSLIGDRISHQKIPTTTHHSKEAFSTTPKLDTTTSDDEDSFGLDKVIQFIFSGMPNVIEKPISQTPVAPKIEATTKANMPDNTTKRTPFLSSPPSITTNSYFKIDLINLTTSKPKDIIKTKIINTKHVNNIINETKNKEKNTIGVGLLKLAGCNIYGRMYRVGRIISELSGPCLECKCTEVGVQCRQLKCSSSGKG